MTDNIHNENLLGSCGLYCRACPRYRVTLEDGKYLLDQPDVEAYEDFYCDGCHSQKLSEFCQSCKIRLCAKGKGIHHCGLCSNFPCEELTAFAEFGKQHEGARHRAEVVDSLQQINRIGAEAWLAERDLRWRCSCGFIFSGYEVTCHACGKIVDSFANSSHQ